MSRTTDPDRSWRTLGEIAVLLERLANQMWGRADDAGLDCPLHDLGLGCFLAAAHANSLIPTPGPLPEVVWPPGSADPVSVLKGIFDRTESLDPSIAGTAELTIAVAALVREAGSRVA